MQAKAQAASVFLAALLAAGAARAADASISANFNLGAASDYVFRGVSQTRGRGEVFGGVDLGVGSSGYAGAWASNVDFADGTDFEYDLYAGVRPRTGPVTLDFGVIRYGYGGRPKGSGSDYWEAKAGASIPLGPATFGAAAYYSPDFLGRTGRALYGELNASTAIPATRFFLSGAIGRQTIQRSADYTTWNLGVGYAISDRVGVDLRYFDTDSHGLGDPYRARLVASLKVDW